MLYISLSATTGVKNTLFIWCVTTDPAIQLVGMSSSQGI